MNPNHIYIVDADIIINEEIYLFDQNGKYIKMYSIKENENYTAKKVYEIKKSYMVIDFFDTEEEAIEALTKIYIEIGD